MNDNRSPDLSVQVYRTLLDGARRVAENSRRRLAALNSRFPEDIPATLLDHVGEESVELGRPDPGASAADGLAAS